MSDRDGVSRCLFDGPPLPTWCIRKVRRLERQELSPIDTTPRPDVIRLDAARRIRNAKDFN